jgi:hypothetical protein
MICVNVYREAGVEQKRPPKWEPHLVLNNYYLKFYCKVKSNWQIKIPL